MSEPNFTWGGKNGRSFCEAVNGAYDEVVQWRRNVFKLPSGQCGKAFVRESARLMLEYAEGSSLECIALKSLMLMPMLLLQKPFQKSKAKDHQQCLKRRLTLWSNGDIQSLLEEGRAIQLRLTMYQNKRKADTARVFANLMFVGKVKAALRLVSNLDMCRTLSPYQLAGEGEDRVIDILKKKHPAAQPLVQSAIIEASDTNFHPVLFDEINGPLIRSVALKTQGSAGPSGLDAAGWKRMCTSYQNDSDQLCEAIARLAIRVSTTCVDPEGLTSFVACRLIALDKCPGVRPIGVGEVLRRIVSKTILSLVREDIQRAVGPLQLCVGHEAGCEAAVHALRTMFKDQESEAVLLVDASNAFNSLNRNTALRNVMSICPSLATITINTYRQHPQLFIQNQKLLSREGTTQGDPLAMAIYAISLQPLVQRLNDQNAKQVWFADDASAGGKLDGLKQWWEKLRTEGPKFGYYPNPNKTWIVVKEGCYEKAVDSFSNTGIQISRSGREHLGSAIGDQDFTNELVGAKVRAWSEEISQLSIFAESQPQAAYSALTHGLSSKWNYLMRTTAIDPCLLQPLEDVIRYKFLPAITGKGAFSDTERALLALPVRLGGLGIVNPTTTPASLYMASISITAPLTEQILQQRDLLSPETRTYQAKAKTKIVCDDRMILQDAVDTIRSQLPLHSQRCLDLSCEKGASTWLTVLPIQDHGFTLYKSAFRDALCLRYGWEPKDLASHCICGKPFGVEHALSCPTGGFPIIRHNELRDLTAGLMIEVCHGVAVEPTLQTLSGEQMALSSAITTDDARVDIQATGFWGDRRQRAFFDVKVFNPFAKSFRDIPLMKCYKRCEQQKKRAYEERIREVEHGSFTPLIFSAQGGMSKETATMYKRLASLLSSKRSQPYSSTINWIRCRIGFALLRSMIMCLRGARSSHLHFIRNSAENCDSPMDLAISEGRI